MRKLQGRGDRQGLPTQDGTQSDHRGKGRDGRWPRETATLSLQKSSVSVRPLASPTEVGGESRRPERRTRKPRLGVAETPAHLAAKPRSTPQMPEPQRQRVKKPGTT